MSIRLKLIVSFLVFFILGTFISLGVFWMLSEIEKKTAFLEIANSYMLEIQQARRFEKNFLLYGTNIEDICEHLRIAEKIFNDHKNTIEKTLGRDHFITMGEFFEKYQSQISLLEKGRAEKVDTSILRESGGRLISFAEEFVRKEKQIVTRLMGIAKKGPFIFTACLIVFLAFLFSVFMNELIFTLNDFMLYTKRVGEGNFSPIKFEKSRKNEFAKLADAFNQMVTELNYRYRVLVESQKLRAIGTLVAGVAHELNNPLNNSMLTASIMKEDYHDLSDAEKLEMLDDLIHETDRSKSIVKDLLDFARESETKMRSLDVRELLEDSARLVTNQMKFGKVKLEMTIDSSLPDIHGDEQMLKQVFVNLLLNAVDAMPSGGKIKVSVHKNIYDGYLGIFVEDNGHGIPEHIRLRIFEPFFTTKSQGKGVGLGLSVSMGIIKKHGGFIEVESEDETGTVFKVFLPVTQYPSKKMMESEKSTNQV
jgi:signal transduction histidine kinase